jgi:alanyl-tRNA synthetase
MTTDEIREAYLDFFVSKGCVRRPSDVLVPKEDKTVLFTPAGMNQFKREFMGLGDPNFKRATTSQMCIRTGDIENVGKTPRHMTFFEMLGNFSFGDYFKSEAIHWAWEFLTVILKIPADRLTVTVYLDDDEAYGIWNKEIGLDPSRITRMGEDDNFWPAGAPSHGPDGVCGPCSEIFYHGDGIEEVEIWNLVFTQFNRVGPGQLEPLPAKNIDTGMGLERLAAVIQQVPTNFDIDIFKPLVAASAEQLQIQFDNPQDVANQVIRIVRRIADHVRTLTFCIHENVKPGPNAQGYVLRLLLRRALVEAYRIRSNLGTLEPFLYKIVPVVAEVMAKPYPELRESVPRIQTVIREEEEQFFRTLENGMKYWNQILKKTKAEGSDRVSGKDVFVLHATHGFPVEVTEFLAVEENLAVDRPAYDEEMDEHGKISRPMSGAAAVFTAGPLDALKKSYHHGNEFLGYTTTVSDEAKVIGIVEQNQLADSATIGPDGSSPIVLILDKTPFYGESGGQVGDIGVIRGEGFVFQVTDTKKENDFTLHIGKVIGGTVGLNSSVKAEVNVERREAIRRAHSATHVLHHALHIHLGKHAQQAGSKVEPDRLRFDFANPEAIGRDRLRVIEETVNHRVLKAEPVSWTTMPIAQAKTLGAMALFGEKYPEVVRVVSMGDFSRELCGGTHLDNVGQIGLFKVIGEESVSAGTRRITALTGKAALDLIHQEEQTLAEVATALKVPTALVPDRVAALLDEVKSLKKQISQRKAETAPKTSPDDLLATATLVGNVKVVATALGTDSPDDLRQLIDVLRRKQPTGLAILLASSLEGKVNLAAGLTPDVIALGLNAGQWLKAVAPIVGGGGGGRPDLAQAGGKLPDQIPSALEKALEFVREKMGR